ncbi:MAG: hypothetical protein LBB86_00270 [Oscillospiraceae bacterium]|jgi:hypothetical protein|nr:hypothetical protein [Oscillospiraceae bacterium]
MQSKSWLDNRFAQEKPLKELAREATFSRAIPADNPGGSGGSIMGVFPRITSPTTKAALWGTPDLLTLSLLKTDVIDRRYVDDDHYDLKELMEGAYSEANKDLNDMPLAGMTRPSFYSLTTEGGRYNHALWSEVYSFPCQKPVGQIILKTPELSEADQPDVIIHMKDGTAETTIAKDGKRLHTRIIMSMTRNIIAVEVETAGLTEPITLRLYRNVDQGHRRYMDENGHYLKFVVNRPADPNQPLEYYDFEKDRAVNGLFEPPTSGTDGRYFWIHQVFPGERTFPEGFRYVMMGLASDPKSTVSAHPLQRNLGSAPRIRYDNQGLPIVPGIRTMTHPEMFNVMAANYSYVAEAPGVAADAQPTTSGKQTFYISIATLNETPEYMNRAKALLAEAERLGFDGLAAENQAWYDALYEKRENGRVLLGETREDRQTAQTLLLDEAFTSWTSGHMGYCNPDPRKLEGSASYACYDVDTQSWHSLPCYNELFTEGKYFMRNQYEPKRLWPNLITAWHETLKEKARLKFGLPGMCIAHGYLPAAAQSPWYVENAVLDFCMEVPAQIVKVIWNFWDYAAEEETLRETVYPIMKDLAVFYEAFARRGWDGKVFNLEPTVETESYGISYRNEYTRNNTGALTLFRWTLRTAAGTAKYLGLDADLTPGWLEVADNLAPYPMFEVETGSVIGANEKAFPRYSRGDHYMFSGYYPVNLADEVTLDSPREQKELFIRTADVLGSGRNWDPYILLGASKDKIPRKYTMGALPISDHVALANDILESPERLLNSRSGRIHLFPSVPEWTTAAFRNCLARGGFEVSAARDASGVQAVTVKARRGIPCRLMNPWPGAAVSVVDTETGAAVPFTLDASNGECIGFDAKAGHTYSIDKT